MNLENYNLNKPEDCINFLVDSDEPWAIAKGRAKAAEFLIKAHEADQYLSADGKNVEDRKALARLSVREMGRYQEYQEAVEAYELLNAKRATASIQIEIWRSKTSARKAGVL